MKKPAEAGFVFWSAS